MARPFPFLALIAAALGTALSGCAHPPEQTARVEVIGAPEALFATEAPLSPPARLLRGATAEGLVALDAEGRVVPAMAERWIIADEGQSYIFRLRDGLWSDGVRINAESARAALSHALAAQHGTPLGLDLGVVRDVRAMAARVVEIRLRHPMPDFLQVLAQPELGLAPSDGATGPLALRREGSFAWLTAIPPDQRGLPVPDGWAASVRPVTLTVRPAAAALADFAAGRTDLVLGGRFTDYPGTVRGLSPQFDPVSGLFGLVVENEDGVLATPDSREAIAMALDRAALGPALGLSDWAPTTRILPAGGAERWASMDGPARRESARQRLAAWGGKAPTLRIALPAGHGADVLAQHLTDDLAQIGVKAQRVPIDAPADLRLLDAVARYPSPAWVFHQFACALRHPCSPESDALATQAEQGDSALYARAEAVLIQSGLFIPLGPPLRWSLAAPGLAGFQPNRWAYHPLPPLTARAR